MTIKIGSHVIYIDEYKKEHDALITQVWGDHANTATKPGLNVVYVSDDENQQDPYGRQLKRETSIVHLEGQPAKARCWKEA
jgi:hypothetical protein